jgi:hypothetical protein
MSEAQLQSLFFEWFEVAHRSLRNLCFAIPNGGRRDPKEAYFLKKAGVTAGVPDVLLCKPNSTYHGLFIEFKFGKNRLSGPQQFMIQRLVAQGYAVGVCYTLDTAMELVANYLKDKHDQSTTFAAGNNPARTILPAH